MAKGQFLSKHQQGIVNRYYQHADSRVLHKLQELVSDLYLATDEKAAAKLWKSADLALSQSGVDKAKAVKVLESKDVKALAAMVGQLAGKK